MKTLTGCRIGLVSGVLRRRGAAGRGAGAAALGRTCRRGPRCGCLICPVCARGGGPETAPVYGLTVSSRAGPFDERSHATIDRWTPESNHANYSNAQAFWLQIGSAEDQVKDEYIASFVGVPAGARSLLRFLFAAMLMLASGCAAPMTEVVPPVRVVPLANIYLKWARKCGSHMGINTGESEPGEASFS